jgi:hypothetical protein
VMVSPLNNVFTFRNAHMCLQCAACQARSDSNFPRQMTLAFRTHKPTAKESDECVLRGIPCIICINTYRLMHLKICICIREQLNVCDPYENTKEYVSRIKWI